jgi:CRISPR-associated endonuclease/helicase Cas3
VGILSQIKFDDFFRAATAHEPFDYQRRLAEDEVRNAGSQLISVPTGLGKTAAVVMAWLWNRVVRSDLSHRNNWPRRLVYCLPMRTLVNQTRANVSIWLGNLANAFPNQDFEWLKERSPVILMGGENNERNNAEWDNWPEKPCILIGTQDMLLSRALNRGYAASRYRWPVDFGLLNNDCLWIMDEVQLMGPGLWTSGQLDWMRLDRFGTALPSWTWWMSATNSDGFLNTPDRGVLQPNRFSFEPSEMPPLLLDARRPCIMWTPPAASSPKKVRTPKNSQPLTGSKNTFLSALASAVVDDHQPGSLSLIVCNTVQTAQSIHSELQARERRGASLILLTSRFRKRDRTIHENTLLEFEELRKADGFQGNAGLICVATQVLEAGMDVSACRLWTELAPWPSLVQRLGRLNRDGKSNDKARAKFFEVPVESKKNSSKMNVGPYSAEAMTTGRWLAARLVDLYSEQPQLSALAALALMQKDEKTSTRLTAALQPAQQPFPRAMDIHGLFSTEPDLFGGFTDISRFVRGEDPNADAIVFWRDFDDARSILGPNLTGPAFDITECCAVPVHRLHKFLEGKVRGFVWDDQDAVWRKQRTREIVPGMLVMLPGKAGGYDSSQGWTGLAQRYFEAVPPPGPFDEGLRTDSFVERGEWVTIADHLSDVRSEADRMGTALQLETPVHEAIVTAAQYHDIGKALPQWQHALPCPSPDTAGQWAKAPYLFAVSPDLGTGKITIDTTAVEALLSEAGVRFRRTKPRPDSRLTKCTLWHTSKKVRDTADRKWLSEIRHMPGVKSAWMVPFRPELRHEAASALALWHLYFRQNGDFPGLTIYLTAAHHGKVRTVLTARTREGNDVFGVSRKIALLPWKEGLPMDFSCASDGADGEFSPDGDFFLYRSPGWTALIADLLGGWEKRPEDPIPLALRDASEPEHLGPFMLAFFETLVRCADVRASQNPSQARDVEF